MLKINDILKEAEQELVGSGVLKRVVKLGILSSVLQATLETYRPPNAEGSPSDLASRILGLAMEKGTLRDLLHDRLEIEAPSFDLKSQSQESGLSGRVTEDSLEEMTKKVSEAVGLTEDEQAALIEVVRARKSDVGEGEVLNRTDEELAEEELRRIQEEMGLSPSGFGAPPESFSTVDSSSLHSATS